MRRRACINIRQLPLQLLLLQHPQWRAQPCCVLAASRPTAPLLQINQHAADQGLQAGMTYATALSLVPHLQASTIEPESISTCIKKLHVRLHDFSPHVQCAQDMPGVFWVDGHGLGAVFDSVNQWAHQMRTMLKDMGFEAHIVAGFGMFGCYAISSWHPKSVLCFCDSQQQHTHMYATPLSQLSIPLAARAQLQDLGIQTLGDLAQLPADTLRVRLGPELGLLHHYATGQSDLRFCPQALPRKIQRSISLEAECNTERLIFQLGPAVENLCQEFSDQHSLIERMRVVLVCDQGVYQPDARQVVYIMAAQPGVQAHAWIDLLRLRLESIDPGQGIVQVQIIAYGVPRFDSSYDLFSEHRHQSLDQARQALARIVAQYGPQVVAQPVLADGHTPEARFGWRACNLESLQLPRPAPVHSHNLPDHSEPSDQPDQPDPYQQAESSLQLVRRILHKPARVQAKMPSSHPAIHVSGAWWRSLRGGQYRVYQYHSNAQSGASDRVHQWMYYDARRQQWMRHGWVQ